MPVDEFGREIPAPSDGGEADIPRNSNSRRSNSNVSGSSNPPLRPRDRRPRHACFQYMEDPLLCEYVWKDQNNTNNKDNNSNTDDNKQDDETKEGEEEESPYDVYRRKYCLQYIRAFFNHHLDDVWFRNRYSPASKKAAGELERERSIQEAQALLQEAQNTDDFIANARLGGGTKNSSTNATPSSHLFSWQQPNSDMQALVISEIPPAVTDEQLWIAVSNATDSSKPPPTIYGSRILPTTGKQALQRRALLVAPGVYDMYNTLKSRPEHIPRKQDDDDQFVLDFEVDCTDPYGREEYDADGRGGAPADGLAYPPKKATVAVQKLSARTTPTAVLSAALSARQAADAPAAREMAAALDERRDIPNECRLQSLLEAVDLVDESSSSTDLLDVSIAYLRRVHLVSFYNGCDQPAETVADMLTTSRPAGPGTIHLRLEKGLIGEVDEDDMLVQRLETSISKALEPPPPTKDDDEDKMEEKAEEIKAAQEKVQEQWLQDHSILDQDDRARCSFHFCHKLFKDTVFLHKHLLKKHVAYLHAEQAKCHDPHMMEAWDNAEDRPVPDVLVDCGSRFGFVAAPVTGKTPDCVDPEPALWQHAEEERRRQQAGMRVRREEVRQREPSSVAAPRNFVDVDDMKEEKVELSFDNVQVVPTKKKKKKKRKLL